MLRKARIEDLSEIITLEKSSFEFDSFSSAQLRYLITKSKSEFLVYLEDKKIIAYAIGLTRKNAKNLRIYSIAVAKNQRQKGIGKKLFLELEKIAKEKNLKFTTLEVRSNKEELISIYQKFSYKKIKIIKNYYPQNISAIKMQKNLWQNM